MAPIKVTINQVPQSRLPEFLILQKADPNQVHKYSTSIHGDKFQNKSAHFAIKALYTDGAENICCKLTGKHLDNRLMDNR